MSEITLFKHFLVSKRSLVHTNEYTIVIVNIERRSDLNRNF